MRHFVQIAYGWYCIGWLVYRWYQFMRKHHEPKAEVTTLFHGEK